jgi:biopolymer transport protein ExbB/TolQ
MPNALTISDHPLAAGVGQPFFAAGGDPFGGVAFNDVLLAVAALLSIVLLVIKIHAHVRRTPSLDKELTLFATRQELEAVEQALTERGDERRQEIEGKIREMSATLSKQISGLRDKMEAASLRESTDLQSIQRQLGEITGWVKAQGK